MGIFNKIKNAILRPFRIRKALKRREELAQRVKKRKPLQKPKAWKVELMRGIIRVNSREEGDYELLDQVRVFKYYRIKPQKRWIEALKRMSEAEFKDLLESRSGGVYTGFLEDSGGDIRTAEEIRRIDVDEMTMGFGALGRYISGRGEL